VIAEIDRAPSPLLEDAVPAGIDLLKFQQAISFGIHSLELARHIAQAHSFKMIEHIQLMA